MKLYVVEKKDGRKWTVVRAYKRKYEAEVVKYFISKTCKARMQVYERIEK